MSIDDFLGRLEGVESTGEGKWVARCPAHDDSNPSLGVAVGNDGRILVKCYAGCTTEAVVAAMGLKMCDLMPEGKRPKGRRSEKGDGGKAERKALGVRKGAAKGKAKAPPAVSVDDIVKPVADNSKLPIKPTPAKRDYGRLVASYDYQDESGAVVFRVERRVKADGKKTFIQRHPDPSSKYGWSWGLRKAGVKRVPFRLPKVIAAAKAGKSVVIVEGEKDVLSVERVLGGVATCNPGGAGKWEEGWGKYFKGCRAVAIIADKDPLTKKNRKTGVDEPFAVGQKHACKVEALLRADGYDGPIRKFFMPDVAGEHVKDFTDWVEAVERHGGKADKSAFQKVINEFPGWPEEWEFDGADLVGFELASKNASSSASDSSQGEGGKAQGASERAGRFGRPAPRAPDSSKDGWKVDFDIGGGKFVTLDIKGEWDVSEIFGHCYFAISKECLKGDVPKDVPPRLKAWSVAIWLLMRGSFFWNAEIGRDFEKAMYLDRNPETCRLMRIMSNEFFAFVGAVAKLEDIEPKRGDMAKILGLVKQISVDPAYSQGVVPGNSWMRKDGNIYISNGDTMMCKVSAGKAEMVQNGTDGVVFLRGNTLVPWKLMDGDGDDPIVVSPVFKNASWMEASGSMNIRLWILNLFACHKTKPLLLITGLAQSGKTRMARAIKEVLGIRKNGADDSDPLSVEDGDKGREAFWVSLNSGVVEIFDNLDTKIKWVGDDFQRASTGGALKRRSLYKDDEETVLRSKANIIITSNNPLFTTEGDGGMSDRIITVSLRPRTSTDEHGVDSDISANRDRYLTWIARTLSKVLADTGEVSASVNRRHPDYGAFSIRCGRALGCERDVEVALGAAEIAKAMLPLHNDTIMSEVMKVLEVQSPPWSMRFTSGDMSKAILARFGDDVDERTKQMFGCKRIGRAMKRYERQLSEVFKCLPPRTLDGRTTYEVMGLTAAGEIGLAAVESGKVGFMGGVSEKSYTDEGADGLPQNGIQNALNPLHARAPSCDSSLGEEEKNIREEGDVGIDDLEWRL